MTYGTLNVDQVTNSDGITSGGLYGFKNRIINGAMMIDQRNAGASITANDNTYGVDRFKMSMVASSKGTIQQSSTAPAGFKNSLLFTSSAATSVGSTDYYSIVQPVEGLNVADFGWGAVGAATITISFWVRSSLTGTFGGSVQNSGTTRSYPFSYAISSANTWEQKTITVAGDTTGTWLTTNGIGLQLRFSLGMGSTYSGTANAWVAGDYESVTGATSVVGTNGATFYITGVQLEAGTVATSFDWRPYGTELSLCQRYYAKTYDIGTVPGTATYTGSLTARCGSTENFNYAGYFTFPVSMRADPTITIYAPGTGAAGNGTNNSSGNFSASLTQTAGTAGVNIQANNVTTNVTTSNYSHVVANAEL